VFNFSIGYLQNEKILSLSFIRNIPSLSPFIATVFTIIILIFFRRFDDSKFSVLFAALYILISTYLFLIGKKMLLTKNSDFKIDKKAIQDFFDIYISFHFDIYKKLKHNGFTNLHPVISKILTWGWIFFFLSISLLTSDIGNKLANDIYIMIAIILTIGLYIWISNAKINLVEKYPYHLPLNLLELRVFGNNSFKDFIKLSRNWHWVGVRYRLDGPDTAGNKIGDMFNFFYGNIQDSIVKNIVEFYTCLRNFSRHPNYSLQFPTNSMQCGLNIWGKALLKMISLADVVAMDLSDLKEKNVGVVYEIEQLFNLFPIEKTIFLVNNNTDWKVLNNVFKVAFDKMTAKSPNFKIKYKCIKVYNYETLKGDILEENPNYLTGLLYEKAKLMNRNDLVPDPLKDHRYINWGNFPYKPVRLFAKVAFVVLLVLALLNLVVPDFCTSVLENIQTYSNKK